MKVIFLSKYFWPRVGGVERHVYGLSRELVNRGYEVVVMTSQFKRELPLSESLDGVKVIRLPYSAHEHKISTWKWMWNHLSEFRNADIVHVHDVFWWYWLIRFRLMRKPVYVTFHGYEGVCPPRQRAVWQRKFNEYLAWKNICVGDYLQKWYGTKPNVITYGAAHLTAQPLLKKQTAVYVGRLEEDTGIMKYVEAIKLMQNKISLEIYGDGRLRLVIEKFVAANHLPVRIAGWYENQQEFYQTSRYAFVSGYLSIVEAMQSKRLVCANYSNPIRYDYLRLHPMSSEMILFQSPGELAMKLSHLSENEEHTMIEIAYKWAKKQTFQQLADQYENLWRQ